MSVRRGTINQRNETGHPMSALLRPNLVIKRRGVIVVAVLILCSLIFAFNLRTPGARLRNSVNSAVLAQRRVILDRQRAITAAELAEDDADVRSETLRWTNIISNLTGHMTSQRSSTPREDLVEHPAIESRNAGHWAFENLMRVRVPTVLDQGRARNPIDRFIIARLEQNGLSLQPPASPWILARRLWLGVTGLPPEPEDIRQIENADSEDFDRFVDDLGLEAEGPAPDQVLVEVAAVLSEQGDGGDSNPREHLGEGCVGLAEMEYDRPLVGRFDGLDGLEKESLHRLE